MTTLPGEELISTKNEKEIIKGSRQSYTPHVYSIYAYKCQKHTKL